MTAAKSRKGKKSSPIRSRGRKQRREALQPLLTTGWLDEKAKALRKKVGLPEDGLDLHFDQGEYFWEEVSDWWVQTELRSLELFRGQPPEKNPLSVLRDGVKEIMEKSGLKDDEWEEFFRGYIVGYLKDIDKAPLGGPRAYLLYGQFGRTGDAGAAIVLEEGTTLDEIVRIWRLWKESDTIWQTHPLPDREREDAEVYRLVETRQDWYPFSVDETRREVSKNAACRQIAIRRLREKYRRFGEEWVFSQEEEELEFFRVRNAYNREKKRRRAQGD